MSERAASRKAACAHGIAWAKVRLPPRQPGPLSRLSGKVDARTRTFAASWPSEGRRLAVFKSGGASPSGVFLELEEGRVPE